MAAIETFLAGCSAQLMRIVAVSCGGLIIAIFGSDPLIYQAVAVITGVDFLTGMLVGAKNKNLNSRDGFASIKKWTYFALLLVASVHLARLLPEIDFIAKYVAGMIAINEFLSVTENGAALGLPMPKQIKDLLSNITKNVPKKR